MTILRSTIDINFGFALMDVVLLRGTTDRLAYMRVWVLLPPNYLIHKQRTVRQMVNEVNIVSGIICVSPSVCICLPGHSI